MECRLEQQCNAATAFEQDKCCFLPCCTIRNYSLTLAKFVVPLLGFWSSLHQQHEQYPAVLAKSLCRQPVASSQSSSPQNEVTPQQC